jgi:hypothetical protein
MTKVIQRTYEDAEGVIQTTNVILIPAILQSIPTTVLKNSKDTQYRRCPVLVTFPDGTVKTEMAQLYENYLAKAIDTLVPNCSVQLEVQTEGEGAGLAKLTLAPSRIDFAQFLSANATADAVAVAETV